MINIAGVGRYRGALETVVNESGELNVVNALSVDNYVKGVIPNESPPSWPMEELKAQAVASRSFALTGQVEGDGYDLYSDTRSQVYKGLESEYTTSDQAEEETAGQVLMYEGQIAETLFSACSGGKTESNENVFGAAIPYLVGVPDPYDEACPLHELDAQLQRPRNHPEAERPARRGAEKSRDHEDRLLAADHRSEALRHRRRDHRRPANSSRSPSAATRPG